MKKLIVLAFFSVASLSSWAQKEMNVASYNLRMDTSNDKENAWPNRKDNVNALVRYHDFDIMGTQEGFIHQLKDILRMEEYAVVGKGRDDGKEKGEHSAIFYKKTRFTLLDAGDFWLSETPNVPGKGWDATCCNRIASWAKLKDKQSKKTFFVFNVHFDHQGKVARRESGKLMVAKIQEIAKNAPVILTGDFNSEPETEQIQYISSHLKDAYKVSKMPAYGPEGTFSGFKFTADFKDRIDYIFVSKGIEVLKYASLTDFKHQRYPSDHLPIVAKIRF